MRSLFLLPMQQCSLDPGVIMTESWTGMRVWLLPDPSDSLYWPGSHFFPLLFSLRTSKWMENLFVDSLRPHWLTTPTFAHSLSLSLSSLSLFHQIDLASVSGFANKSFITTDQWGQNYANSSHLANKVGNTNQRSEEHTSELQSR